MSILKWLGLIIAGSIIWVVLDVASGLDNVHWYQELGPYIAGFIAACAMRCLP